MPIKRVPTPAGDEAWLVTGYDQVKTLLADRRLGRGHADPDNAPRFTDSVLLGRPHQATEQEENERHTWMRRMLNPEFSARNMEALRPRIRNLIHDLLDDLVTHPQPANFHELVSFPLPVLVICELLGVPYADRTEFRRWSESMSTLNDQQKSIEGATKLWTYMNELVQRKKAEPGDDVITRLAGTAADEQIAQLSAGLLFAGHETTVSVIDRGVMLLSENPGQWDALKQDPKSIPAAVEEILRHRSLTSIRSEDSGLPRYAMADIEVEGVRIPQGDLVLLGIDQANRDEVRFPDPETFTQRETNPHLTFGHGPRFCIGAPLARVELTEVFHALTERFETFGLAVEVTALRPRTEQLVGGVAELPVRWTAQ
ncbi:cytochrome P450 [Lentzea sp. NEAU-D13]|uniref:Cytochrome P450 n=1 Tax=Lentzea alba TaxID=2714351 RepID=A0A7C9VTL0_9PSEU|nr:cytochrome P450 [Lentzea alba]NGY60516.1 cytochrome P450 [Lentzea alba]